MISILVPTDFSNCSMNAFHCAAELANHVDAKIFLLHVFHPQVMISEVPDMPSLNEMKEIQIGNLENLASEIRAKHGNNLTIETACVEGFAVDEIEIFQRENEIDLIFMGMKKVGALTEKIIGSLTTSLMYKSFCPILSIPENYKFKKIEQICFASDFDEVYPSYIFHEIIILAKKLEAKIHLINVSRSIQDMTKSTKSKHETRFHEIFDQIPMYSHYIKHDDIVSGINDFIVSKEMDMVVMIPKKHSFWENVLHEPNTKKIAFHANIPVMALCEYL